MQYQDSEMSVDDRSCRALDRRRELNRQAAQKLRNKQKEKAISIKQLYFAAQSKNTQLNYEVKQLRKFKEELEAQINGHVSACQKTTLQSHYGSRNNGFPASHVPQSQSVSFPVAYYHPSVQSSSHLTPFSYSGSQIVVCSRGNDMSSGLQVLTINPYPVAPPNADMAGIDNCVDASSTTDGCTEIYAEPTNEVTVHSGGDDVMNEECLPSNPTTDIREKDGDDNDDVDNSSQDDDSHSLTEVQSEPPVVTQTTVSKYHTRQSSAPLSLSTAVEHPVRTSSQPLSRRHLQSTRQHCKPPQTVTVRSAADMNLPLMVSAFSEDD
jgi:hypothetical protein